MVERSLSMREVRGSMPRTSSHKMKCNVLFFMPRFQIALAFSLFFAFGFGLLATVSYCAGELMFFGYSLFCFGLLLDCTLLKALAWHTRDCAISFAR